MRLLTQKWSRMGDRSGEHEAGEKSSKEIQNQ